MYGEILVQIQSKNQTWPDEIRFLKYNVIEGTISISL